MSEETAQQVEVTEASEAAVDATLEKVADHDEQLIDQPEGEVQTRELPEAVVELRNAAAREIDVRLPPWGEVIDHEFGPEWFERGAFADTDPSKVLLMGLDHETLMGLNQRGEPLIRKRPMGVGRRIEERSDAAYVTFKVAGTAAGDEFLALLADGVVRGISPEFIELPGGTVPVTRGGRRGKAYRKVKLVGVAPTWRPAYERAAIVAMRSAMEGDAVMAEDQAAVAAATESTEAPAPVSYDFSGFDKAVTSLTGVVTSLTDRVEGMEERYRSSFTVPGAGSAVIKAPKLHEWASIAGRMLTGGNVSSQEIHERALQDVVSPDNPGAIPEAFVNDLIGIIQPRRPFLASTRQIAAPETGLALTVPVLDTRSTVGVQSEEKTDIASTAMKVTTDTFDAITIAGGADVSIQLIRRGSPSFFDLLMRDLSAAYAAQADLEAVAALLGAGTTPGDADLDPENLMVGDAWANSIASIGLPPDRVWLSSNAVAEFIDAKDNGTNRPLYFNLNANFAAGTGTGGNLSALQPVYTPALDGSGTDVLIGPGDGFAWAEDGTFTLQVDVPSKAGRDVAIVGILFLVPRYPAAFTSYALAS